MLAARLLCAGHAQPFASSPSQARLGFHIAFPQSKMTDSTRRLAKLAQAVGPASTSNCDNDDDKHEYDHDHSVVSANPTGVVDAVRGAVRVALSPVIETARHGGEKVAAVLAAHGVKFIFTLVGGHISPLLVASAGRGIRVIDVRNEATAMFAADAVGRLTGIPGVVAVTAGPGVTNCVTAAKNAAMAQSPVILIGGAAATVLRGRGALQDIDQVSVLKSVVKLTIECRTVRDITHSLRLAFQTARSGIPGPVYVEIPIDLLYPVGEVKASMGLCARKRRKDVKSEEVDRVIVPEEAGSMSASQYVATLHEEAPVYLSLPPGKHPSFIMEHLMKAKLAHLFAGAWDKEDVSPLPVPVLPPSERDVISTTTLLASARRPVLLIGSQATIHPDKLAQVAEEINGLGIPTYLSGMARGLLGASSPVQVRQRRRDALREADVIILAGVVCDFRLDYGRALGSQAKVVCVNRSMADLMLNADAFWQATVASASDPADFLLAMATEMEDCSSRYEAWLVNLRERDRKTEEGNAAAAAAPAFGHGSRAGERLVNPLELFMRLDECLPENSLLIGDGGDFVATASYILRPRGPLRWLDSGAFGTLGVGAGFALGAKLCMPDAEVWLIWGDGSCGYSIAEYDTFLRHGVPIIGLVGNDACWTQIEREQVPVFRKDTACPLVYTAYEVIAEGWGGAGQVLTAGAGPAVTTAIKHAQAAAAAGQAFLLNVHIGRTTFRDGSLSV